MRGRVSGWMWSGSGAPGRDDEGALSTTARLGRQYCPRVIALPLTSACKRHGTCVSPP